MKSCDVDRLLFLVPQEAKGQRLDSWLAAQDEAPTRSQIKAAAGDQRLLVDDQPARVSYRLRGGEKIALDPGDGPANFDDSRAEEIDLEVLYEDDQLVAINKRSGMVVHPAVGHTSGTLVNAVLGRYPQGSWPGEAGRAGVVHRLDRDTSGVILVARTVGSHEALSSQFRERIVRKTYLALVRGEVKEGGRIDLPIGRHPRDRKRMSTVARQSRSAITDFEPLEHFGAATLLEAHPLTGRTHQLRVHFAARGWPIIADPIYGGRGVGGTGVGAKGVSGRSGAGRSGLAAGRDAGPALIAQILKQTPRLALHAAQIEFNHPTDGRAMTLRAPLAADIANVLEMLRGAVDGR